MKHSVMDDSICFKTQSAVIAVCFCVADQHILIGADEGIYTLNMNELHESTMELVR